MSRLAKSKMSCLDEHYTSYNPDQEIEGPDTLVDLCCALHGPYSVPSERLRQKYIYHLKPPHCPGCKADKLTDAEYLSEIKTRWSIQLEDNPQGLFEEDYPTDSAFKFMNHWNKPK